MHHYVRLSDEQTFVLRAPHLTQKQIKVEILKLLNEKNVYLEKENSAEDKHTPTNFGHEYSTSLLFVASFSAGRLATLW